jgi:23S rRNA (uridine2552-2'-O)-methyltransferase
LKGLGDCGGVGRRFTDQRQRDPYYRAAQREGLRSRASFKLTYLADRFPLFHLGDIVLDLGAAPGGWSVVARQCIGRRGRVVAVDPRAIEPIDGVEIVHARVGDARLPARLGTRPFDVVLSDMSPSISGAYATDHARSVELVRSAFDLARSLLRPGGNFVSKVFDGDLLGELESELSPFFAKFVRTKPPASRGSSSEMYLLGFRYRPVPAAAPE